MFPPIPSPNDPIEKQPTLGLIGMGAMGKMYANLLSKAGWKKIHVCDRADKYEQLKEAYSNVPGVKVMKDGHAVARSSDFMMYSVEAEFIDRVVAEYGPSTKLGAIVAGQTSVKAPEKDAFEKHLPQDAQIISCHSLHGPTVSPLGQPLILIQHRGSDDALHFVEEIFRSFGSRYVYLSYEEHDLVTANTQAVTHAAFLSMGTAWASARSYPWEQGLNLWHVYAGLAILNPKAREQINQYTQSATELFKLMLEAGTCGTPHSESETKLRKRIEWAKETVFGKDRKSRKPILLSQEILDKFSLGRKSPTATPPQGVTPLDDSTATPTTQKNHRYQPNSHLSLLAMVDCWAHLDINPFDHLDLAATPLFRLFLGVAEHLFLSPSLLDSAIHSAIYDTWHRSDDLEFVVAARGWSQCVKFASFEVYKKRFSETREFFEGRFEEAGVLGSEMIKAVMASEMKDGP